MAFVATCAVALPTASAADVVLPFTNYQVGGSLTIKKLNQSITLPAGSTFTGSANVTQGELSGHVVEPRVHVDDPGARYSDTGRDEARRGEPVQGTLRLDPDFATHIRSTTAAILRIKRLRIGSASACRPPAGRRSQLVLTLNYDGAFAFPINFNGTTTIPPLTGCELLGPTLGVLLSGPGTSTTSRSAHLG